MEDVNHDTFMNDMEETINLLKGASKPEKNHQKVDNEDLGKLVISINTDLVRYPNCKQIIFNSYGLDRVNIGMSKSKLIEIRNVLDTEKNRNMSLNAVPMAYSGILTGFEHIAKYFNQDISPYTSVLRDDIYVKGLIMEIVSDLNFMSYFKASYDMNIWLKLLLAVCIPLVLTFLSRCGGSTITSLISPMINTYKLSLVKPEFIIQLEKPSVNNVNIVKEQVIPVSIQKSLDTVEL